MSEVKFVNTTFPSLLSSNGLKFLAIFAMVLDHVAWLFFPVDSFFGVLFHGVGRVAAPVFFFLLVVGYLYTSNVLKYCVRLFVFALISQAPFAWFQSVLSGESFLYEFFTYGNVIFTLLLALLVVLIVDRVDNIVLKILLVSLILLFSLSFDWGLIGPLLSLVFFIFRDKFRLLILSVILVFMLNALFAFVSLGFYFAISTLFGGLLFLILFLTFDGDGGVKNSFTKWFFYLFYPFHFLLLILLRLIVF